MPTDNSSTDNYVRRTLEFFAGQGDAEAIIHGNRALSYADICRIVPGMAANLRTHGIEPGAGVAAVTANHAESVLLLLALHLLGCRAGFIAVYRPSADQLAFVQDSGAQLLVHDGDLGAELIRELGGGVRTVTVAELQGPPEAGSVERLIAELRGSDREPSSLFLTSGTTGRPKLVHHGHRFYQALLAGGEYYRAVGEPPMRHLNVNGFATVSGQMPGLLALFGGGVIILPQSPDLDMGTFLDTIRDKRVTSTFVAPVRLYELIEHVDHAPASSIELSSLRYLNCGGSAASSTRLSQAIDRFGPVVRLVYGMAEAPLITDLPFLSADPAHPERLCSCGTPFADMEVEIRDERGVPVPAGETGEVWAAGTLVMAGYWGQPELTAQTVVEGWLRTGDLGYLDRDGYLYLVDRAKDVVKLRNGYSSAYSRIIEDVLVSHPAVRDAAVVGVPDDDLGEAIRAFVVTVPGAVVSEDELCELIGKRLDVIYIPRDVEFLDALPLTSADKVDKQALRAYQPSARC